MDTEPKKKSLLGRLTGRMMSLWRYVSTGVWSDMRPLWWVKVLKTLNLSVRSFFRADLQSQAAAMTFRTLLAIVPALALVLAIGRGFGLSELIQDQLYQSFPAQHKAISAAMVFVDSYLEQMGGGVFVGVGIVFLLWTLISLISNIEDVFNKAWGLRKGRPLWQKITDYTAMLLILPVLMICAAGLQFVVSTAIRSIFHFSFLTPVVEWVLEVASWAMTWVFFGAAYKLIPNTKVNLRYAMIAGVVCGTAFLGLEWLFVTGQMYVSKYNAIYGSFAFVPLLLIWMQLTWLVTLAGAVICYSLQNFFRFNYSDLIDDISIDYRECIAIGMMAVVAKRFRNNMTPVTAADFMTAYNIPARVVTEELERLEHAGLVNRVILDDADPSQAPGYTPAEDVALLTVQTVRATLFRLGRSHFIPGFDQNFAAVMQAIGDIDSQISQAQVGDMPVADLDVKLM